MRNRADGVFQQLGNIGAVLRGNADHVPNAETAKFLNLRVLFWRIHFVDGEKERLTTAQEQSRKLHVGRSKVGAPVDHKNDGVGFGEGDLRLRINLLRDELLIVRNNAASVDDAYL